MLDTGELVITTTGTDEFYPEYPTEEVVVTSSAAAEELDNSSIVDDQEYQPSVNEELINSDTVNGENLPPSHDIKRKQKRKRDVDRSEWLNNKRKSLRDKGKPYLGVMKDKGTGEYFGNFLFFFFVLFYSHHNNMSFFGRAMEQKG